ncbi:MAG: PD40 domain-containing protein [Burkholderiales bacterium]|nr:PD40 domain-containing protein [Burkholderiales bacterium]
MGVTVNAVGGGESFQFALGAQGIAVTQGGQSVKFGTALASGAAYTVSQASGPRTCTLSANRTGSIAANVEVTADCGTPPAPPAGSRLKGELRGPVGANVLLRTAAGDSVSATVPVPAGGDLYNAVAFELPAALANGSAYTLTVQTAPAGQTCRVYKGASGTTPVADSAVKVGCEWNTNHVSRSGDDSVRGTFFESTNPAIGGDASYREGRFVAFMSSANLGGNAGGQRQIWWRDTMTGETRLISTDAAGNPGNGDSFAPAISRDGLTVAFESYATNLVAGDTNGVRDVFVWSSAGGTLTVGVTRASVAPGGVQGNAASYDATLSADGRVVVFSSDAGNLVAGTTVSGTNAYRRDLQAGTTTLVSRGLDDTGVGGALPSVSADGNRVAFWSFAANLTGGDSNGLWDIFVYDHAAGTRRRVSLTSTGGERNQGSESASRMVAPALSGDGRFVAYATTASNVVPGDTNGVQDVFVVEIATGAVQRASVATGGAQGDAASPIGQGERPAISHDGTWIAFTTTATNLGVPTTTTGIGNVLMHHRVTGETRAVSDQRSSGSVGVPTISMSGTYVAFGASSFLDARFAASGLFTRFTDLARAWFWVD